MRTHLFLNMAPVHGGTFLDVDDPSSPEAFGVTERSSVWPNVFRGVVNGC